MNVKNQHLVLICGLLLLLFQVGSNIKNWSSTVDEPALIGVGASYLHEGKLDLEYWFQPPLMKYLFGAFLIPFSPSYPDMPTVFDSFQSFKYGFEFVYKNTLSPQLILTLARLPVLLLSLLLGWFVYQWSFHWFGKKGALFALFAYALEPSIIAHSSLATTDLGLTCFMFLASYCVMRYLESKNKSFLCWAGILGGLAITSKISGLFWFIWLLIFLVVGNPTKKKSKLNYPNLFRNGFMIIGISLVTIILVYQVRFFPKFFALFGEMLSMNFGQHEWQEYVNFFHGEHKVGGWIHYFLTGFLIKTPIPLLILFSLAVAFSRKNKKIYFILLPIISFFLICSLSSKQNGLRYLLPIYPFVCLMIGCLATVNIKNKMKPIIPILFLWLGLEAALVYPHHLSYFNQLVGGSSQGYKWLVDCNLDWGQDYPSVNKELNKINPSDVIMATYGPGDLNVYFDHPRQDLIHAGYAYGEHFTHLNSLAPRKEVLVISASLLQGFGLSYPKTFSWLLKKEPLAQPAYSTFIYDVTNDVETQYQIGKIYQQNKQFPFALRQFQRSHLIRPDDPVPLISMGDVYELMNNEDMAQKRFWQAWNVANQDERYASLKPIIKEKLVQ